jgi:hypothetical protein
VTVREIHGHFHIPGGETRWEAEPSGTAPPAMPEPGSPSREDVTEVLLQWTRYACDRDTAYASRAMDNPEILRR